MLRSLQKTDLSEILVIENAVHISPWTAETFKVCFQSGYGGWVVEVDNKIVGFIIIAENKEDCHILNICVAHDFQHRGYGYKLINKAIEQAKKNGLSIAYLEVRRSNHRAITLYQKIGFHFIGERKEYYPGTTGNEDALVFAMSLINYKG